MHKLVCSIWGERRQALGFHNPWDPHTRSTFHPSDKKKYFTNFLLQTVWVWNFLSTITRLMKQQIAESRKLRIHRQVSRTFVQLGNGSSIAFYRQRQHSTSIENPWLDFDGNYPPPQICGRFGAVLTNYSQNIRFSLSEIYHRTSVISTTLMFIDVFTKGVWFFKLPLGVPWKLHRKFPKHIR